MSDLFGGREGSLVTVMVPGIMGRGWSADQPIEVAIWLCDLCGAVVGNQATHKSWHAAGDPS